MHQPEKKPSPMVNSNPANSPITIAKPFGDSERCGQIVNRSSGCGFEEFSTIG